MNKIVYQGVEYNVSPFLKAHPGGAAAILEYLAVRSDVTECLRSTHSKVAEQRVLSLEVVGRAERSKSERIYCKIEEMVRRHYSPSYFNEIALFLLVLALFAFSLWSSHALPVIAASGAAQVLGAWGCHSQLHSRAGLLLRMGKFTGGALLGLSCSWWRQKHERHHLFTNHDGLDQDIAHNYPLFLAPLLLLKWRLQSLCWAATHFQVLEMALIAAHYFLLFRCRVLPPFLVGLAFASLFIAVVTQGNHEREKRFRGPPSDFLVEQLESTRDYEWAGWGWSWLLGGFNLHSEHHLFPQVPFYELPRVRRILQEELENYKKSVETGPMLF